MKSRITLIILLCLSFLLSGCIPSRHLYNEASLVFEATGDFDNPALEQNKANNVLFLISVGYIQPRNDEHLSIYIDAISTEERSLKVEYGVLKVGNTKISTANSAGIKSGLNHQVHYPIKRAYEVGVGYFHFSGKEHTNQLKSNNLELEFKVNEADKDYIISLPLKSKIEFVWPT